MKLPTQKIDTKVIIRDFDRFPINYVIDTGILIEDYYRSWYRRNCYLASVVKRFNQIVDAKQRQIYGHTG